MLNRILAAGVLSCALAGLGACSTVSAVKGGGTSAQVTQAFLLDAQTAAVGFCAVAPTAETIASLVTADPALGTATAAAQAFCALVAPTKLAESRKATRKLANGVVDFGTVTLPNGARVNLKGRPQ